MSLTLNLHCTQQRREILVNPFKSFPNFCLLNKLQKIVFYFTHSFKIKIKHKIIEMTQAGLSFFKIKTQAVCWVRTFYRFYNGWLWFPQCPSKNLRVGELGLVWTLMSIQSKENSNKSIFCVVWTETHI